MSPLALGRTAHDPRRKTFSTRQDADYPGKGSLIPRCEQPDQEQSSRYDTDSPHYLTAVVYEILNCREEKEKVGRKTKDKGGPCEGLALVPQQGGWRARLTRIKVIN